MDIEGILDEIRPVERTVEVCTAGHLVAAMEDQERLLQAALKEDQKDSSIVPANTAKPIVEEIQRLEAEMAERTRVFRFQAMPAHNWRVLVAEHPPEAADREQGFDYNADSLPIAAVAVCCVDPVMTVEQAAALAGKLQPTQWSKVWLTCREANTGGDTVGKSVTATAVLRHFEQSSTTPSPSGSPTPSSSGE